MNNIFKNNFFNLIDMENINLPIKCNKLTLNKNEEDEDEENEENEEYFYKNSHTIYEYKYHRTYYLNDGRVIECSHLGNRQCKEI